MSEVKRRLDPLEVLDWTVLAGMVVAGGSVAYRVWVWSSFTESVGPFLASALLTGGCYWLSQQVEERRQQRLYRAAQEARKSGARPELEPARDENDDPAPAPDEENAVWQAGSS